MENKVIDIKKIKNPSAGIKLGKNTIPKGNNDVYTKSGVKKLKSPLK